MDSLIRKRKRNEKKREKQVRMREVK